MRVLTAAVAAPVMAGVTVVLCWAGDVTVPVVFLACLGGVVPACGFAAGYAFGAGPGPLVVDRGPGQVAGEPGPGGEGR
jgi:hypothetical protein